MTLRCTPPSLRSLGSAESGVLRHYTPLTTPTNQHNTDVQAMQGNSDGQSPQQGSFSTPTRRPLNHAFTSHVAFMSPAGRHTPGSGGKMTLSTSPSAGVAGEKRLRATKPAFPLNVQQLEEEQYQPAPTHSPVQSNSLSYSSSVNMENIDFNPHVFRGRALSVFEEVSEEVSETECVLEISNQIQSRQHSSSPSHHSPLHSNSPHHGSPHPRSRRISNTRSSPNIFGSVSKSDVSEDEDEEEDDDIVELMTTSGRFPSSKVSTFSRMSPSSSPLLTSRYSPTHYLTGGSSDDESCSVFETARKIRSKRLPFRKRSIPKLVRVDSISSDDGKNPHDVQAPPSRKGRLLRLRQYNSLPSTPADNSASESLTEILDTFRKTQALAATTSCRTDSSLSDGGGGGGDKDVGELASSILSKFELSDEDGLQASMELDPHLTDLSSTSSKNMDDKRDATAMRTQTSTTLHSMLCNIL